MNSAMPAMHRAREALPAGAVPPVARVLALGLLLFIAGCSIDTPQTPQFETQVFLPLGVRTTTGLDLIDDDGYIEGDSAGVSVLRFVLRGTMEEIEVGPLLDLDPPATRFSFGLAGVRLVSEQALRAEFPLSTICDQVGPVPRDIPNVLIAPFTIPPVRRAVSPPEAISWVHLERGLLRVRVSNQLPIALGGVAGSPLRVRLRNRLTGAPVATAEFASRIGPGESGVASALLHQAELASDLDLELSGRCPGSDGVPVDVRVTDHVGLEASFADLVADSAYAEVPAQSLLTAGKVLLAQDMRISEGFLRTGTLRFAVENPYPVAGTGRVTFPSVHRGADPGEPLFAVLALPAASGRTPGRAETTLELAGVVVRPAEGSGDSLGYRLEIETRPSTGPVRLGIRAAARGTVDPGRLAFDSVRGRLTRRPFQVSRTETRLDPPEGIDSLSFVNAELALEITSTVAIPAEAVLTLLGVPAGGGGPVSVPLRFSVAAAVGGVPRVTTVTIDETNSNILALLLARPRTTSVSGDLFVGDGGEGTILRSDRIGGRYTLSAPLRMRVGRITHRTDPTGAAISEDDQDLIRNHVIAVAARGTVTNHFPAGLEVRLVLAGTEADLALEPATYPDRVLWLEPVAVAPGETDPVTGRVVRARVTPVELALRSDQVAFFDRDSLYSQAVLVASGEDARRTVEVTALDFVQVTAMLSFRVRVQE